MKKNLYKSHGVLWRTAAHPVSREEFIADNPLCPNPSCHTTLEIRSQGYFCVSCDKLFQYKISHPQTRNEVQRKWEGHTTLDHDVYSLDLPLTKVIDEDNEDKNYWVQVRISEKGGKRMAVIYFGEKIKGKQDKGDYSQIFLDFEDEQVRFDKSNKNPMKILAKLTAEFADSTTILQRNTPIQNT